MATLTDIYNFVSPLHRFQHRCLTWMMGPPEQELRGPNNYGAHDPFALELVFAMIPAGGGAADPALFAAGLVRSALSFTASRGEWCAKLGLYALGIEPAGYADFYSRLTAANIKIPSPGPIASDGPTSAAFRAFYATFSALRANFASYSYPPGRITELNGNVRTSNSVAVGGLMPYPPG